ncbi:xylose isomerase [Skermanella mucosa]|uniref:xylose isomerase n=1 Tax=Skermanella mucosa TaxID=1789672 RepID=UPI00192CCF0F|nr:xylose isomerase [Skermanella mucosa]UEM23261.1 xylose isomerase [Skermanella mucosa]
MTAPYFETIGRIPFKGPESDDPLAFRHYEPDRLVLGKRMEDHLRVAVCWWHTFCWPGVDMFGAGTFDRPWQAADTLENAELKLHAAFEFFEKLGVPFFCFHDADVAPLGETIAEGDASLARIEELMRDGIDRTGVKLLWGTANLFSHRRYMAGGATNPDPEVFAFAAAQVARVLEMTHRLGGENYVLWGGREGYDTLLNTDMKRELDQLGRFMSLVVEHKHRIGFKGTILIEPKPMEPTKHQYDHDAATVHAFLRKYGLENEIKLNLEVNHATLAGHSFEHEVAYAIANGLMGSFDINRGDPQNGWDTDQFPNDDREAALALYHVLSAGGLTTGGFNFDAKVRRQSIDPEDLFIAHIGGMDTLARGLLMAERMIRDGKLAFHVADRYAGWNEGLGADILDGRVGLGDLAKLARDRNLKPEPRSGRQEYLENLVNRY